MYFLGTLIAAVGIGVTLYLAMAKYQRHRLEATKKEAEFLAAMKSGKALPQPTATSVTMAMETAIAAAKVATQRNPSGGSPGATATPTLAPVPVAVPPAPAQGLDCMFCQLPVDMMANDASRWGAKLPDAKSGRFVWAHFDCLNQRLTDALSYQACLAELVATGAAVGDGIHPRLLTALQNARAVLLPGTGEAGVAHPSQPL